ncbi:MAG: tetratricopeptide repeat protein [Planctomycetes bacterium]|nr:tetratricopeptide repeat protein [Planctomycetota bacterium]
MDRFEGGGMKAVWGGACGAWIVAAVVLSAAPALRAADADAATLMIWAGENLNAGRFPEAVTVLRKAVGAAKEGEAVYGEALFKLIGALRTVGGYAEGLQLCEQFLKKNPDDKRFRCLRGELLDQLGHYEEAFKELDALVKADPAFERAWAMRKLTAATLGKKDVVKQTIDHFFDLFQSKPDHWHSDQVEDPKLLAYIGLGIKDENPKDAFEVGFALAEALSEKRGIRDPEVYLWTAELAFEKYAWADAAQRYRKVLEFRPNHPDALTGMARIGLTAQNQIEQAKELIDQVLQTNPNHVDARLTRAVIHMQEDNYADAWKEIEAARQVNANHLDALAVKAFYHAYLGEKEKEAAVEKQVLAINPKHADYYCSVGEMLESKYGFWEAPVYYQKSIDLDPGYWRGYYGLGMSTSRMGAHGELEGKRLLLKAFQMNRFNVWASNMIKVLDKVIGDEEQQVAPQYKESKTEHFALKFFGKEEAIVRPYMEEWAEEAWAKQTKLFEFEPQGPLTIELMYSFPDQAARTVGLPNLGALGVCFGKLCTVVSPREGKGNHPPFNWRKVLDHEFCHVMTLQMAQFRMPRWYTEAFSTYVEDDSRLNSDGMMVDAIAKGQLKKIEDMNEYFRGNMLMAYVHGRYIVEYLDKTFGMDAHRKALRMFAEGKRPEEVFPAVTGKSLEELNEGQFKYVREFFAARVKLRPSYDQADMAELEMRASKPDATADQIAELAVAHMTQRKLQLAEAGALKAMEKDPNCADAINVLGKLAFDKKDYLGAKKLFEQFTEANPDKSFIAWHHLGVIYKKEGKTTAAIKAFEQARRIYPRYVGPDNPHHELPKLYLDLEPPDYAKAIAGWKLATEANTEDAEAPKEGLKLAVKQKDWASAAWFAMRHIEINPYDVFVHRKGGEAFEALKDLRRAAREFRIATQLDEQDIDSWVALGRVELEQGNREAAVQAVRSALHIDGTHEAAKVLKQQLGL